MYSYCSHSHLLLFSKPEYYGLIDQHLMFINFLEIYSYINTMKKVARLGRLLYSLWDFSFQNTLCCENQLEYFAKVHHFINRRHPFSNSKMAERLKEWRHQSNILKALQPYQRHVLKWLFHVWLDQYALFLLHQCICSLTWLSMKRTVLYTYERNFMNYFSLFT